MAAASKAGWIVRSSVERLVRVARPVLSRVRTVLHVEPLREVLAFDVRDRPHNEGHFPRTSGSTHIPPRLFSRQCCGYDAILLSAPFRVIELAGVGY